MDGAKRVDRDRSPSRQAPQTMTKVVDEGRDTDERWATGWTPS